MKKAEYYSDILEYIELRFSMETALEEYGETKDHYRKQLLEEMINQIADKTEIWLQSEVMNE